MCLGSPITRTSTLVETSTWPAGLFCQGCFWQVVSHLLSYTCPKSPVTWTSTLVRTYTWLAGSCCLCCFWQAGIRLWDLQMSRIPPHTYLHPGRNIYLTSWFILSVLFLIHREMSVIPTSVWDPPSHGPPPWDEHLPDQLVHSVCVVFDRWWHITWTSTLAAMSTWSADLFCLCSFWQAVWHLWSLHLSWIPHHMHLYPSRNIYLTSWFILSVFLTGVETSVVTTCVWDPPSHGPPPWDEHLPNQLVYSVCFDCYIQWDVCGPYTCPESPITWTPPW